MNTMTFNKFDDIENLSLRVFNRVIYLTSLGEDGGEVAQSKYLGLFSEGEKRQIAIMALWISNKGAEAVRKEVQKNLVIVEAQDEDGQ